jgi:hypothetical protein
MQGIGSIIMRKSPLQIQASKSDVLIYAFRSGWQFQARLQMSETRNFIERYAENELMKNTFHI